MNCRFAYNGLIAAPYSQPIQQVGETDKEKATLQKNLEFRKYYRLHKRHTQYYQTVLGYFLILKLTEWI